MFLSLLKHTVYHDRALAYTIGYYDFTNSNTKVTIVNNRVLLYTLYTHAHYFVTTL